MMQRQEPQFSVCYTTGLEPHHLDSLDDIMLACVLVAGLLMDR